MEIEAHDVHLETTCHQETKTICQKFIFYKFLQFTILQFTRILKEQRKQCSTLKMYESDKACRSSAKVRIARSLPANAGQAARAAIQTNAHICKLFDL